MTQHRQGRAQISLVIPSRERPGLLAEALAAVAMQTLLPAEVIVAFDQTEPEPLSASGLPTLRIKATGGHRGAAAARNLGARTARGPWLAFLDDDDWWLPGYLEQAATTAKATRANVIVTSFLASDHRGLKPEKEAPRDLTSADFFAHNPGLRGSNLFIRRDLYLDIGGFNEDLPALHDLDLGLKLARWPKVRYARVRERLVVVRKHAGLRLTSRGSPSVAAAVAPFLARYGGAMSAGDRRAFADRLHRHWGLKTH